MIKVTNKNRIKMAVAIKIIKQNEFSKNSEM